MQPAGMQAGDFLLATVVSDGSSTNMTPPAGFLPYKNIGGPSGNPAGGFRVFWFSHVAAATEPTTYRFARAPATGKFVVVLSAYTGVDVDPTQSINAGGTALTAGQVAVLPAIVTTVPNTLLVANVVNSVIALATWTPPAAMNAGATQFVFTGDEPWPAVGTTGARTIIGTNDGESAGILLALKPK